MVLDSNLLKITTPSLKTGDILLFDEHPTCCCMNFLDSCIKCCTREPYSHAALVIVNPPWKDDNNTPIPKGTYVWESSYHGKDWPDIQNGKTQFGVQLQPIELYTKKYPGHDSIWVRRLKTTKWFKQTDKLEKINNDTKNKSYDINICDWLAALFKNRCYKRRTKSFYCSAFVSYTLSQLGMIPNVDWTIVSPALLSSKMPNNIVNINTWYEDDELYTSC